MTDPADLSAAYVAAFNKRDWHAIRTMLADRVSLRFPGFAEQTDPDQVVGFYRQAEASLGNGELAMGNVVSDGVEWCAFTAQWNSDAVPDVAVFHQWENNRLKTYRGFIDSAPTILQDRPD